MRKIFTVLSILLVLGLGGLGFFLYQSLDEENYRKQVIQATRDLFGREMVVSGKTSISLFPSPVITLNDVHVVNKNGMPSKELISVGKVRASVKWESLFKNPLVVENIILEKPHLFLERNKKGENNWDFPFLAESTKEGQKDILIGSKISGRSPQFEKIIIKDGLFTYTNEATGFSKTLSNLNGELSAFINCLMSFKGKLHRHDFPSVSVAYANNLTEAGKLLDNYKSDGYMYIKDEELSQPVSNAVRAEMAAFTEIEAHNATCKAFDKVVMLIDDTFFYDEGGNLRSKAGKDHKIRKLFHGLSRAKSGIALVVRENSAVFDVILFILQH